MNCNLELVEIGKIPDKALEDDTSTRDLPVDNNDETGNNAQGNANSSPQNQNKFKNLWKKAIKKVIDLNRLKITIVDKLKEKKNNNEKPALDNQDVENLKDTYKTLKESITKNSDSSSGTTGSSGSSGNSGSSSTSLPISKKITKE